MRLPTPHEVALAYPKPTDERDQRLLIAVIRGIVQTDRERIAKAIDEMQTDLVASDLRAYDALELVLEMLHPTK